MRTARGDRVDKALIGKVAEHIAGHIVYLCGPPSFMRDAFAWLRELDVPEVQIRYESFGDARMVTTANGSDSARIVFSRSGLTSQWTPADQSLL